jgi:hypothetical protein
MDIIERLSVLMNIGVGSREPDRKKRPRGFF